MQITIDRKSFVRTLTTAARAADRRSSMPILAQVSLSVSTGDDGAGAVLAVTATDLYRTIEATVAATEVPEGATPHRAASGTVLADAKRALDCAKKLAGDTLTIRRAPGNGAMFASGGVEIAIPGLSPDDFPATSKEIEGLLSGRSFTLPVGALRAALNVAYCASKDDTRPHLAAVLLEIDGRTVRGVATDGHRLARTDVNVDVDHHGPGSVYGLDASILLPLAAALDWTKALPRKDDDTVEVAISSESAGLMVDGAMLAVKLTGDQFPPYAKVIPCADLGIGMRIDAGALRSAVERAIVSGEKITGIVLALDLDGVAVTTETGFRESVAASTEVYAAPPKVKGKPVERTNRIGVSAEYLLAALKRVVGSFVIQVPGGELDPIVVRDATSAAVIMPMRM